MYTIDKKHFKKFVENLMNSYAVMGPVKNVSFSSFEKISSAQDIDLDFCNTPILIKDLFLPRNEVIFKFKEKNKLLEFEIPAEKEKRLLLGVRPCDMQALLLLDKVYSENPEDEYFLTKRKNTIIVGMACLNPDPYCFCTSFGIGPSTSTGFDLFLTDIGDKYFVEVLTDKGKEILNFGLFKKSTKDDEKLKLEISEKLKNKITKTANTKDIEKKLEKMFNDPYWSELSQKCVSCSLCSFLCPTCYCFDVVDESSLFGNYGERIRCWDSCQRKEFQRMALDHNPRAEKTNRVKQRFYHKFDYFAKKYGVLACTGCGRCLRHCPVDLSIPDVINEVQKK